MSDSPARQSLRLRLRAALQPPSVLRELDAPPLPPMRLRAPEDVESPLTASDKLERGVDRALERLTDAMELNPEHYVTEEGQLGAWRVIVSAAEKLTGIQVRVDQNRLRRKTIEQDDNILARLDAIEASLPNAPILDLTAE